MSLSPLDEDGIEFGSVAEKKIYELAFSSGYFNSSARHLYYSLRLSQTGNKKLTGEIDFLYLDEKYMLFLEVKGGEVKYDSLNNQWWVMGGTKAQDPFAQTLDSLFQVRDVLLPELFNSKSISNRIIFGYGILFPECMKPKEFPLSARGTIEYSMDIVFDFNDLKSKNSLVKYIENLKSYWDNRNKYKNGNYGISSKELATISQYFRRDLHFRLPAVEILKKQYAEVERLTSVQMYSLDSIYLNPGKGVIISGGPGTGKTLLALELLKRKVKANKKTLFVCYNKNLAKVLNEKFKKLYQIDNFKLVHIHGLYEELFPHLRNDSDVKKEGYWHSILPIKVKEQLQAVPHEKFDFLIIDEAQDLLNEYHFDVLNELLECGFNSDNWAMFLDSFQNIYNPVANEYLEFFKNVYPSVTTSLFLNCRNTKSVVKLAARQSGFEEMPCFRELDLYKSQIKKYSVTDKDLIVSLNQTIADKINIDKIQPSQITVLCFTNDQKKYVLNANTKLVEFAAQKADSVTVSTIHSFKGLENDFILIIGPDRFDSNDKLLMTLLYIGYTRATVQALFFTKISNQQAIEYMLTN